MTNTAELEGAIAKAGIRKKTIAAALSITETALWSKINGRSEFKASEIKKIQDLLSLSDSFRDFIFFNVKRS